MAPRRCCGTSVIGVDFMSHLTEGKAHQGGRKSAYDRIPRGDSS